MILLNGIMVLGYVATLVYIIRKYPRYLVIFCYLSFMQMWALVSCFYNDLGVYNYELFGYTEQTLATARLGIFYIVFNLGFILAARVLDKRILVRRDYILKNMNLRLGNIKVLLCGLISIISCILIYQLMVNGIPILNGIGRFTYMQEAGELNKVLIAFGPVIAFSLGLFRMNKSKITINGILIAGFILYAVLIGNKFSFLIIVLVCYFTPVFMRFIYNNKTFNLFRFRYGMVALGVMSLFLAFAVYTYVRDFGNYEGAKALLFDRVLGMQGEMWWAVDYDLFTFDTFDPGHWFTELTYSLSPAQASVNDVGMRYLMIQIIGPAKAYSLFDCGYLYTMAYPAILIATVPYVVAVMIQLLAGMMLCVLLYYLYYCIVYRHHLRAMVAILIVMPFVTMLFTGNVFVFLSIGMLFKFLLLVVLETGLFTNAGEVKSC